MAGSEILYGVHPVREALRARRRKARRLHVRARGREEVADLLELAHRAGVSVTEADDSALARLAGEDARTQGVVLEAGPLPEVELEALVAASPPDGCLVALDGVEDPQNAGAIVRVSEAAGVSGLILTRRHAPPLSAALARASAGAIEHLPVARVPNLARALKLLKKKDFWVFGGVASGGRDVFALDARTVGGRRLLVLGAEGRGLRPSVLAQVDHRVQIPLAGRVQSLNVSAAAAVLLFELRRRQGEPPGD